MNQLTQAFLVFAAGTYILVTLHDDMKRGLKKSVPNAFDVLLRFSFGLGGWGYAVYLVLMLVASLFN